MSTRCNSISSRLGGLFFAIAIGLTLHPPVAAGDSALEEEKLALVIRQLDLLNRLAEHSAQSASNSSDVRYHFDYARLHADIARIRTGIEDYLTPRRAQPRDPDSLDGSYRRETGTTP